MHQQVYLLITLVKLFNKQMHQSDRVNDSDDSNLKKNLLKNTNLLFFFKQNFNSFKYVTLLLSQREVPVCESVTASTARGHLRHDTVEN